MDSSLTMQTGMAAGYPGGGVQMTGGRRGEPWIEREELSRCGCKSMEKMSSELGTGDRTHTHTRIPRREEGTPSLNSGFRMSSTMREKG